MMQLNPWPFTPAKLSSLLEAETLSVLLSGCSARLGRPMTVLDYEHRQHIFTRVDTMAINQNYTFFCLLLRDDELVIGGNTTCEACDIGFAKQAIKEWQSSGKRFKHHYCHMQLTDFSYIVCVQGKPVAVLLAGQFGEPQQHEAIRRQVYSIGNGQRQELHFVKTDVKDALLAEIDRLPEPPTEFEMKVAEEAHLIERMAEEHYLKHKSEIEQVFLNQLRNIRHFGIVNTLQQIREATMSLLDEICRFCHCKYIIFYINIHTTDTILTPLAQVGLVDLPELPHFNWRKAGLHTGQESDRRLLTAASIEMINGLRGENAKRLKNATCTVASMLGEAYRAAMVFGPFDALTDPTQEQNFFFQVNRIVGWFVYAQLQTLQLSEESNRREAMATLLQHRIRTALTPITTHIGNVKQELETSIPNALSWRFVSDGVRAAHELALQLGKTAKETLRTAEIMVESSDLRFDTYPLAVLVSNCADGFVEQAVENNRTLIIESSVENLPSAEIDIARLTIAISNILENAVKYSYPSTTIYVRMLPLNLQVHNLRHVDIQIENTGNPIPKEKMQQIFERGERALVDAKMGKIPGTGYGLWETKAVIEAHGGTITPTSEDAGYYHRSGRPYKVTFTIRIPLSQPKKEKPPHEKTDSTLR